MPCESYTAHERIEMANAEANRLARMLCALCRQCEAQDAEHWIAEAGAADWWADHKRRDAEREAREAAERERVATAREALAKLSPSERAALGWRP